ncbi:MAG: agmatinase family protein [Planctomycetota bacterium]|nr:agmatinase family protein [Planctomycetota bacterium]
MSSSAQNQVPSAFDPDAAAQPGGGIFGLPFTRTDSRVVIFPVPFDATTSYRPGTADGPDAIFDASMQVDLLDARFGPVYRQGICLLDEDPRLRKLNDHARSHARPIIEAGGAEPGDPEFASDLEHVNRASQQLNDLVHDHTRSVLAEGKIPALLGGEHSTPFGAIKACAEAHPGMGILHVDAHMDLRDAFEGFTYSHASIMHNVLSRIPQVGKLVQFGLRDFGAGELAFAKAQGSRVVQFLDADIARSQLMGEPFVKLAQAAIAALPEKVYVSFDIDGLDPSLCPHTGTPVPGGLSFNQAALLLELLRESGKQVVGFDLVEVAPGDPDEPEWDANVGARVLYKLCGLVLPR